MDEYQFWKSTPRKVSTLWEMHRKFNGWDKADNDSSSDDRVYYVDEIPWL